jgi:hypothetical protein
MSHLTKKAWKHSGKDEKADLKSAANFFGIAKDLFKSAKDACAAGAPAADKDEILETDG